MEIKLRNNNKIKGKGMIAFYFQEGGISVSVSEKEKKGLAVINSFFLKLDEEITTELGYLKPENSDDISQRLQTELKRNKINPKNYDLGLIINNYSKKQIMINENLSDRNIIYHISSPSNNVFNQTNPTLETHYFDYYKISNNEIIAYATPKEELNETISCLEQLGSSVKLITPLEEAIVDITGDKEEDTMVVYINQNKKATIYNISPDKLIVNKQDLELSNSIGVEENDLLLLDEDETEDTSLNEDIKKIKSAIENSLGLHDAKDVILVGLINKSDCELINNEIDNVNIVSYNEKEEQTTALTDSVCLRKVKNGKY